MQDIMEIDVSKNKLIFEQFEVLESCTAVADELNNAGDRTKLRRYAGKNIGGRLFLSKDVRRILQDPYYNGYVTHRGEIYKGEHAAIIDEDTWSRVQAIFKQNNSNTRKAYNSATSSFLNGILKCEKCSCAMTPTYTYNHGLRYRYYVCSNHIRYKTCQSKVKTYPAEELEQKVIDEIVRILRTPEIVMNIYKQAEDDITVSNDNIVSALHDLADVWNYLYPTEQHKIARLLINEASVSEKGIRLRMSGEEVGWGNWVSRLIAKRKRSVFRHLGFRGSKRL